MYLRFRGQWILRLHVIQWQPHGFTSQAPPSVPTYALGMSGPVQQYCNPHALQGGGLLLLRTPANPGACSIVWPNFADFWVADGDGRLQSSTPRPGLRIDLYIRPIDKARLTGAAAAKRTCRRAGWERQAFHPSLLSPAGGRAPGRCVCSGD